MTHERIRQRSGRGSLLIWLLCALMIAHAHGLDTARSIRQLSYTAAGEGTPVQLEGTVLYFNSARQTDLVLHDGEEGVFVGRFPGKLDLASGDRVRVEGRTYWGDHFPMVAADTITHLGTSNLPPARRVTYDEIISGRDIGQWIQIAGIVREAHVDESQVPPRLLVDIAAVGGRFRAWILAYEDIDLTRLIDSEVTVTGVPFALSNNEGRIFNFRVLVSRQHDLAITRSPSTDPFEGRALALADFRTSRPDAEIGHRVHVQGTVTGWQPGSWLAITDGTGFLQIRTNQKDAPVKPGDVVDVIGFPRNAEYGAILEDAIFRPTGRQNPIPTPVRVTPRIARKSDSKLVSLDAIVLGVTRRSNTILLTLETGGLPFEASLSSGSSGDPILKIEAGSEVRVTGICTVLVNDDVRYLTILDPQGFRLALRDVRDLDVLRLPPWLNETRSKLIIGCLIFAGIGMLWHQFSLRRQVQARMEAERELQQAHDELEVRVEERSKQIERAISAQHEAEGALRERNRLASEIHDSLQQGLTALGAQLAVAREAIHSHPLAARSSLDQARALVRYNQEEIRRTVWNLRSTCLDDGCLISAFRQQGNDMLAGRSVKFSVEHAGEPFALPEIAQDHLLRIGQEALMNALKHANPHSLTVTLQFAEPDVTLTVKDDGCGFDVGHADGRESGHFGLIGMRERVRRVGGTFSLESRPGAGTSISITVSTQAGLAMRD